MLMVCPAAHNATTAASSANGNRDDHDQGAAPVAQEEQHHEAGQQRPENRFAQHRLERAGDVARLVQLVADLDVVRHQRLEPAQVRLDLIDDRQRRCVRAAW